MAQDITPGPWEASQNGTVKANGHTVALVYGLHNEKTLSANTKAIAQVPRMIEALKLVASIYPDNDHLDQVYDVLETLTNP